jgi:hypothetical protein
MLSRDEIANGRTFILKLWDADGRPTQWVETLRGDTARRWYDIYATSDWDALCREAADTFRNGVSEGVAEATRTTRGQRCVFIHTRSVRTGDLAAGAVAFERPQPPA